MYFRLQYQIAEMHSFAILFANRLRPLYCKSRFEIVNLINLKALVLLTVIS